MSEIVPIGRLAPRQGALALLGLLLLWPAAINGGAFFFPDSSTYLRSIARSFFAQPGIEPRGPTQTSSK